MWKDNLEHIAITLAGLFSQLFIATCVGVAIWRFGLIGTDQYWNWQNGLVLVLTMSLLMITFHWINRPMSRVRYLPSSPWWTRKQVQNTIRRLKASKTKLPPVYPNGWFMLYETHLLKPGQVVSVEALGETFALFREPSENGKAHVLDAHCPHMGANMAIGGRVLSNNCLQCPFHGWTFRGEDGKCVDIPYSGKVPDIAKVKRWHSSEKNGHIYVWYHSDNLDPLWYIPDIDEIMNGKWKYGGRTDHHVMCHIQEIPENGADVAHLNILHRPIFFEGSDINQIDLSVQKRYFNHLWKAEWSPKLELNEHMAVMTLHQSIQIFGVHLPMTDFLVHANQIGPGIVYLRYEGSFFGKGAYLHHVTPIEPLTQRLQHHVYTERKTPAIIAKLLLWAEAQQLERDIVIWNSKRFETQPLLVKEDSAIARYRRWYSQFYGETSPTLDSISKETFLDF